MPYHYSIKAINKFFLAIGLVLLFIPGSVYVNADAAQYWQTLFSLNTLYTAFWNIIILFLWLFVDEWILNVVRNYYQEDFLSTGNLKPNVVAIMLFIVLGLVGTIIIRFLFNYWMDNALIEMLPQTDLPFFVRKSYAELLTLTLCAYLMMANVLIIKNIQTAEIKAQQLEKETLKGQLSALKNQINPHFLFNSLSVLSSLVKADVEASEKFIDQLAKAYRYILEQQTEDKVLLHTEIDFLNSYIYLLQIRFEHKFEVSILVSEEEAMQYYIAPLTLQLLVENAVKHNRMSSKEPLMITISILENYLCIANNLQHRGDIKSTGMGLQNIMSRYQLLTPLAVSIQKTTTQFIVKVPLLNT